MANVLALDIVCKELHLADDLVVELRKRIDMLQVINHRQRKQLQKIAAVTQRSLHGLCVDCIRVAVAVFGMKAMRRMTA